MVVVISDPGKDQELGTVVVSICIGQNPYWNVKIADEKGPSLPFDDFPWIP